MISFTILCCRITNKRKEVFYDGNNVSTMCVSVHILYANTKELKKTNNKNCKDYVSELERFPINSKSWYDTYSE